LRGWGLQRGTHGIYLLAPHITICSIDVHSRRALGPPFAARDHHTHPSWVEAHLKVVCVIEGMRSGVVRCSQHTRSLALAATGPATFVSRAVNLKPNYILGCWLKQGVVGGYRSWLWRRTLQL
jgi:hypothetical protein